MLLAYKPPHNIGEETFTGETRARVIANRGRKTPIFKQLKKERHFLPTLKGEVSMPLMNDYESKSFC